MYFGIMALFHAGEVLSLVQSVLNSVNGPLGILFMYGVIYVIRTFLGS